MLRGTTIKRLIIAGGTLLCALAIGYVMQKTADKPLGLSAPDTIETNSLPKLGRAEPDANAETEEEISLEDITLTSAVPVPPAAAPQPEKLPVEPVTLAMQEDVPIAKLPSEEPSPAFSCDIDFEAHAVAAAMVSVKLRAPCLPNERFTLHHNGMMFTGVTDNAGHYAGSVPALARNSVFMIAFPNGNGRTATAEIETLEYYDRFVVQWQGESGLQIHALEYGAAYGDEGHVWFDAARDMANAARGEGGFVARLGAPGQQDARMAEVYTFPTGTALRTGEVQISLEVEVTAENCGRDVEAQALHVSGPGTAETRMLSLSMPDCNAVGDYLVLKNMFDDLKIARN